MAKKKMQALPADTNSRYFGVHDCDFIIDDGR